MSTTTNTIDTAYGRLDKAALEEVRSNYDTSALLRIVDELDRIRLVVAEGDVLREMLLRLHGMAHTLINGAGLTVSSEEENLPELAADVMSEVREMICTLQAWLTRIEPLERLEVKH